MPNFHVEGVALDPQDNVYLAGDAGEFDENFVIVLKYDLFGNLLWSSVHQFGLGTSTSKVLVDPTGSIYVSGYYTVAPDDGPNRRYDDVFILKLDSSGQEQWLFSYTSTTPQSTDANQSHHDSLSGVAFGPQGNLVFLGNTEGVDGRPNFLLKLSPDGGLLEESYLALEAGDYNSMQIWDVYVDPLGNIYTSGSLNKLFENPAMLMKIGTGGNLLWFNHWGSGFEACPTQDIGFGEDGSVYAVTNIQIEQGVLIDTHLAKLTPEGSVNWEVQVSVGGRLSNPDVAIGPMGKLWVSQIELFESEYPFGNSVPFLISFDDTGNLRFVRCWYEAGSFNLSTLNDIAVNNYGVAIMVGTKGNQQGAWEIPEVDLDYLPKLQSSQSVVTFTSEGIVDPTVVVTPLDSVGMEDSAGEDHKPLVMYYRP